MNGDDTDRRFWFPGSHWGGGSAWRVKITSSKQHPPQHRQRERLNTNQADLPSSFSSSSSDSVRNCRGFPALFSPETKRGISVNQSHPSGVCLRSTPECHHGVWGLAGAQSGQQVERFQVLFSFVNSLGVKFCLVGKWREMTCCQPEKVLSTEQRIDGWSKKQGRHNVAASAERICHGYSRHRWISVDKWGRYRTIISIHWLLIKRRWLHSSVWECYNLWLWSMWWEKAKYER